MSTPETDRLLADVLSIDTAALLREIAALTERGDWLHAYLSGAAAALSLRAETAGDAQSEA